MCDTQAASSQHRMQFPTATQEIIRQPSHSGQPPQHTAAPVTADSRQAGSMPLPCCRGLSNPGTAERHTVHASTQRGTCKTQASPDTRPPQPTLSHPNPSICTVSIRVATTLHVCSGSHTDAPSLHPAPAHCLASQNTPSSVIDTAYMPLIPIPAPMGLLITHHHHGDGGARVPASACAAFPMAQRGPAPWWGSPMAHRVAAP